MSTFDKWTERDILLHNQRVRLKTAKQHNAEHVGEYAFTPNPIPNNEDAQEILASVKAKRIRQSDKPLMNQLESEWFDIISKQFLNYPRPRAQAKRYRLGNGVNFTPDFTTSLWPSLNGAINPDRETAWEVKGPMAWDDAIVKIKMAPIVWPEIQWVFCWKEDGVWKTQIMLP